MVNARTLSLFKAGSYIMNLARGGIVNEDDLFVALKNGSIGGAAIDCFEDEPYEGPLATLENVLLTQHMGSCSFDCRAAMETEATKDMIRFFKGEPLVSEVGKDIQN